MKILTTQRAFTEREWLPSVRDIENFIESVLKSGEWQISETNSSFVEFTRKGDDYKLRLWSAVV